VAAVDRERIGGPASSRTALVVTAAGARPGSGAAEERQVSGWQRVATSIEIAAVAGIVCAICWSVALRGLLARPRVGAGPSEVARFYESHHTQVVVLLALIVIGTVAFLWFVGVVRSRLGQREHRMLGSVFLGSSVLLAGLVLLGAAMLAAPSFLVDVGGGMPDVGAASLLRAESAVVLSVFAPRIATLVIFSVASLGRTSGALPRWLVVVSYVVGVAEFVNVTISQPTLYVFPAWIALVSVVLLVRRPDVPVGTPGS